MLYNSSVYCRGVFLSLQYNLRLFTDTNSVICKIIVGRGLAPAAKTNAPNGGSKPPPYDVNEGDRNMKATGIVRSVEEYGIIGQTLSKPA